MPIILPEVCSNLGASFPDGAGFSLARAAAAAAASVSDLVFRGMIDRLVSSSATGS